MLTKQSLKSYLYNRLVDLSEINVYDTIVPDNATFPLLVFKISTINYEVRRRSNVILEIDFFDNTTDDTYIQTASNKVKNGNGDIIGLDYSTQSENDGFYQCYIENENEMLPVEKNMSRIHQRYLILKD